MKRTCLSVLAVLCSILISEAADVKITGTVMKTGGGPLKDVSLTLKIESSLSSTTDADGKFSLISPVKAINMNESPAMAPKFRLRGRDLIFNSGSVMKSGKVSVFSGNGKQLFSMDFTDFN